MIQESPVAERYVITQKKCLPSDIGYALLPCLGHRQAVVINNKLAGDPLPIIRGDVYLITANPDRHSMIAHFLSNSIARVLI